VLVVREKDKADPRIAKFVAIYQSPATREFIVKKYENAVVPAF
jgi:D-methionine transport system substrate-binding protein